MTLNTESPGVSKSARLAGWGGYANGRIPLSALAQIPWRPDLRLRPDAASALEWLNAAFRKSFPYNFPLTETYRDYAGQVEQRNIWCGRGKCGYAAVPGTSNHGWALAMDVGIGQYAWDNHVYQWLKAHAPSFGWVHPSWAEPNGSTPEAWHWEFNGTYQPPADSPIIPPAPKHPGGSLMFPVLDYTGKYWLLGPEYIAKLDKLGAERFAAIYRPDQGIVGTNDDWQWTVQLDALAIDRSWPQKAIESGWWSRQRDIARQVGLQV